MRYNEVLRFCTKSCSAGKRQEDEKEENKQNEVMHIAGNPLVVFSAAVYFIIGLSAPLELLVLAHQI